MVANSHICRINGAKSKGAITPRGKAISAQNATKHGLLASKPPLVQGEDLETFQGIVQGLVDEYQPCTPTEHLLIQQIAMGWLRLHRLWRVEAALADKQMLPTTNYPTRQQDNKEQMLEISLGQKTEFHPENILLERQILLRVLTEVKPEALPKRHSKHFKLAWQEWKDNIQGILKELSREYPCKNVSAAKYHSKEDYLEACLQRDQIEAKKASPWHYINLLSLTLAHSTVKFELRVLHGACDRRLAELDQIEAEMQVRKQAELATQTIPVDSDRLNRYERHIIRTLNEALDQLHAIQQRNYKGSMGSFRQQNN